MKIQYRIAAKIKGEREQNFCANATNIFQLFKLFRIAKKKKAIAFFIFF